MDVLKGSPILREVSKPFDFSLGDAEAIADLLESNLQEHNGLGISAIQLGVPVRAFAMRTNPDVVMFNPKIVDYSKETVALDEGCLSFPGLYVKVERPRMIRARFTYKTGVTDTMKLDGMTARIFQHELDHLDGRLFYDHVSWLRLQMALKKAKKAGYTYARKDLP